MIYTTLNEIKQHVPCRDGWELLLQTLGKSKADDEQLSFKTIYESNGLLDAVWCLRVLDESYNKRLQYLTLEFAESVRHLLTDQRSINALDTTRRYLDGKATREEMDAAVYAADAASAAVHATRAATYAASAAAHAAYAAGATGAARAAADTVHAVRAARAAWTAAGTVHATRSVYKIFLKFLEEVPSND